MSWQKNFAAAIVSTNIKSVALHVPFCSRGYLFTRDGYSMTRDKWKKLTVKACAFVVFSATALSAQTGSTDESKRKVKSKVSPAYPELAKRMSVGGKVKIEVVITADGHVRSTRVVGGHPLLVQACQDAVKEWKFLPSSEESTQIVEFNFSTSGI
jgi:TonB family protein